MANVNSINDGFFIAAKEGFVTTTSGPVASGATTVGLNSVAGYSNGDWVTFVINPTTPASKQVFHGQIDAGGSQVINVTWTEGSNIPHLAGATVADYETATAWQLQRKGFEVSHNQDGTLKEAAIMAWLPSGNGSIVLSGGSPTGSVRYVVVGGICTVTIAITINSAITSNYNAISGLPPQHSSIGALNENNGWVVSYKDASASTLGSVTLGILRSTLTPGTFRFALMNGNDISATAPFTWAAGDTITSTFSYPVA